MSDTRYPKRASLEGLLGEIFKLVSRGATDEQWAEWLRVPLEHAAADGNIDLFNELIKAGANGSAGWRGCEGRTLLDAAAEGGNAEVVSGLLAAGAQEDVNVVSASSGRSALSLATSLGHEDAARRLVSAGADVHFDDPADYCDVLTQATRRGCQNLVNDLLMAGARPDRYKYDAYSEYAEFTQLHDAAVSGYEGIVSALLTWGASMDAIDNDLGSSPLMLAATAGHLAVVDILLAAGADVEIRDCADGYTALDRAAEHGHVGVLQAILAYEDDVNAADSDGYAALHVAAKHGQAGAIGALIEGGADMELKSSTGTTPLCFAASYAQGEAMHALLRHGANARVQDDYGDTPLHLACRAKRGGVDRAVDLLLRSGLDETAVNEDGKTPTQMLEWTPIFWTVQCSKDEIERAQLLLARAPNDRAWRRRCWLVMLGSRASRAKAAVCDDSGVSEHGASTAFGREEGGGSKMARNQTGGRNESDVVGHAADGCALGFGDEDRGLGALVRSLIGLELKGVFRTVVGFL